MKLNVLGTEYTIEYRNIDDDKLLKNADGYCDSSCRLIVVGNEREDNELKDFSTYQKSVLRHEIIHAFMNESGLQYNWEHSEKFGQDETTVDWIAIQFPKLMKAFEEVGAL